ncbi:DUF7010 family protein [Salinispora oceanensis]|uniref:DUF7010 family protein n=1 Tax=Salinispora oceanensis TaxID=1050199 RepID=UPI00037C2A3A|nr:hypothetical protein [Salinispora oceanensis]
MDVEEYTRALATANRYGWAFLAAYGSTWLVSAVAWAKASPRTAAIVTLFQGMVALPAALALTLLVPGPPRPSHAALESLSVVLATGQLLGLPVVIFLVLSRRYTLVPLGAVILLVVHFAPYSWLFGTPLYMVLGGAISLAAALVSRHAEREGGPGPTVGAYRTCLSTGLVLLSGAAVALAL